MGLLILKYLTRAALVLLPLVVLVRDWKFHDKRTRRYRQITTGILILTVIFALLAAGFDVYDSREIAKLQEKADELLALEQQLSKKVDAYQRALITQEEMIQGLETKATMAARGISPLHYDFNGVKRETVGGRISVTVGPEVESFGRMAELEESQDYLILIEVCEQQIGESPEWLTPYLYCAVAYANLGEKARAIDYLRHVADNAPGDPSYAMAAEFLRQLEGSNDP